MTATIVNSLSLAHKTGWLDAYGLLPGGDTAIRVLDRATRDADSYCGDVHARLSLYKRLASADKADQIDALLEEITDRFGKLPPAGQTLFDVHRLRVLAKPYGVVKIDAAPALMVLSFKPHAPIDAMKIIDLVQKNRHIKLAGNDKLRIERETKEPQDRAQMIRDVLRALGPIKAEV